jgi:hypothetical protein
MEFLLVKILQLNPPIQLYVPERDDFMVAWFLIDYHFDEHLFWVGPMQKTGEIWTLPNPDVRAQPNHSIGRTYKPEDQ